MKKFLSAFLAILMVLSMVATSLTTVFAADAKEGEGTTDSAEIVKTLKEIILPTYAAEAFYDITKPGWAVGGGGQEFGTGWFEKEIDGKTGVATTMTGSGDVVASRFHYYASEPVDISDMTSSASGRIRLSLRTDSELASDTLKLIAGKIQALVFGIKDPYNIDAESVIPNNVDLEICVGARLGFPKLLSKTGDMPEVVGDVVFRANLSSISRLLGSDVGRPQVDCGIRFMDVPYEVIPSIMKPNKKLSNDVWLFRLTVTWA